VAKKAWVRLHRTQAFVFLNVVMQQWPGQLMMNSTDQSCERGSRDTMRLEHRGPPCAEWVADAPEVLKSRNGA
jgi:hypothetical protein